MKKIIDFPFRAKEEIIRGVALQVFLLSVTAALTLNIIPIIILLTDFSIRVLINPKLSPLVFISNRILPITKFRKKMISFKPKRFAAGIGMFMSIIALVLFLNNLTFATVIVMLILSIFSSLEAFFKFCAGCKIFGLLMKIGLLKEDECIDCVFQNGGGI